MGLASVTGAPSPPPHPNSGQHFHCCPLLTPPFLLKLAPLVCPCQWPPIPPAGHLAVSLTPGQGARDCWSPGLPSYAPFPVGGRSLAAESHGRCSSTPCGCCRCVCLWVCMCVCACIVCVWVGAHARGYPCRCRHVPMCTRVVCMCFCMCVCCGLHVPDTAIYTSPLQLC